MTTTIGQEPASPPQGANGSRRGGLIAWGVLLIVIGAVLALVMVVLLLDWGSLLENALMQPAAQQRRLGHAAPTPQIGWADVVGMAVVLAAAAGAIWTGIAACLARRWVRPVVLVVSTFVIVFGLFTFIGIVLTLPSVLTALEQAQARRTTGPSPYAVMAVFAIRAGLIMGVAVILPWFAFRFFLNERTAELLAQLDPRITWLDRCPPPLLGWSAYSLLIALSALLRLTDPALPAFITVLKGAPAIIGLSGIGVLTAWGAVLCYRRDRLGWIITFVVLVGLRASACVYLWTGGAITDLMPDSTAVSSLTHLQQVGIPPWWLGPVVTTLDGTVLIIFGLFVATYFSTQYRFNLLAKP